MEFMEKRSASHSDLFFYASGIFYTICSNMRLFQLPPRSLFRFLPICEPGLDLQYSKAKCELKTGLLSGSHYSINHSDERHFQIRSIWSSLSFARPYKPKNYNLMALVTGMCKRLLPFFCS